MPLKRVCIQSFYLSILLDVGLRLVAFVSSFFREKLFVVRICPKYSVGPAKCLSSVFQEICWQQFQPLTLFALYTYVEGAGPVKALRSWA